MLTAHKKVWPFLCISASIQFVNLDYKVSRNGVHVKRLSSYQKITLRFMVWVNSIKFL
jgi:hypothetical protein